MTVRLGLVGCGNWGVKYLSASDSRFDLMKAEDDGAPPKRMRRPLFEFTHVSRVSKDVDSRMGRGPVLSPLKRVDDWKDMPIALLGGVVVATPPSTHLEICSHFLRRGVPVMVEKPMTLSLGSALALERVAKGSDVPFLVNHIHLFSTAYEALLERANALHSVKDTIIVTKARGCGPFRDYSPLWDFGPHDLSMILGLGLGKPKLISHVEAKDGRRGSSHVLTLKVGAATAIVDVGNGAPGLGEKKRSFEFFANGLRLTYDDMSHDSKLHVNGRPVKTKFRLPLDCSVTAFARAVKMGETDWRFGPEASVTIAEILSRCR